MKFRSSFSFSMLVKACVAVMLLSACETFSPELPSGAQVHADENNIASDKNVVVLVRSEEAANRLIVNAARRNYQLQERTKLEGLGFILLDFNRPPGVSGAIAISDMQSAEPTATAGLDHLYQLQNSNQRLAQSYRGRVYADRMVSWPDQGCNANNAIGMIDGPVDDSLPALSRATIVKRDFAKGKHGDADHGDAIASLLVGQGRLNGARLYSASVISDYSESITGASVSDLILALDWLQKSDVPIVNISLAGPYNKLLDRVIQRATSNGMIVIAAVGNDGPNAKPRYPAAFPSVIAVTAIDAEQSIYENAVRGSHVDFSAPGVDVFIENAKGGKYISGTSVAAPFVTALIASDANLADYVGANKVRKILASRTTDLGVMGRDRVFGIGLIQSGRSCGLGTDYSG